MVSFTDIAHAITENPEKGFSVNSCIPKHELPVESVKTICEDSHTSTSDSKHPFEKIGIRMQPIKASISITPTPTPHPSPHTLLSVASQKEISSESESESEKDIPLPTLKKAEIKHVSESPKSQPVKPEIQYVSEPPKYINQNTRKPNTRSMDPICIGITIRDAMYEIASTSVRQSIEAEEARFLESKIADLYKTESGRSRGWTKTDLEAFFQLRAASGCSLPSKHAFVWPSIFTDKRVSAQLDFICLAKGIRLAVWNGHEKTIGIWPAADLSTSKQVPPLLHVNQDGCGLVRDSVFEEGWKLRSALSVEHSLEKLSVDELDNLAEKMGILECMTGKKSDRIRILAAARVEQRLR